MGFGKSRPQAVVVRRRRDQVHVIGHPAIGPDCAQSCKLSPYLNLGRSAVLTAPVNGTENSTDLSILVGIRALAPLSYQALRDAQL
jgi:hypothetical protein